MPQMIDEEQTVLLAQGGSVAEEREGGFRSSEQFSEATESC